MTVVDRQPFEPIEEVSRRQMVLDGIGTLAPLEPGTIITHAQIAEWLGEERFPVVPKPRLDGLVVPSYEPMADVADVLLRTRNVALKAVPNVGYVVLSGPARIVEARDRMMAAARTVNKVAMLAAGAPAVGLPHDQMLVAQSLAADAQAQARTLLAIRRKAAPKAW